MHDASGCNSTYTTHDEPRWYDMDSMIYISGLSEMEAIMGDDEKLIDDITDAALRLRPEFIAIAGTPIPAMTGFDFKAVAEVIEQRIGIPCFGVPTTGMNTYIHGASMAFAGLAERFVEPPEAAAAGRSEDCRHEAEGRVVGAAADDTSAETFDNAADDTGRSGSERYKVNILGLTPLDFSVNGQDESIAGWLESEGFEVVSRWAMGSSLDEIRRSAEADVDLVVSAAGLGAADVLYERFGIPYIAGLPIGDEPACGNPKAFLANMLRRYSEKKRKGTAGNSGPLTDRSMFIMTDISRSQFVSNALFKGTAAVIGEGVMSLAIATAIEAAAGMDTKVLCATDPLNMMLRGKDRVTPDEDDIIPELAGVTAVIADPLYKPVVPDGIRFISLPHEGFSGRIFRNEIPDLVKDPAAILKQIKQ